MKILIWGTGENAQKYLKKREIPADEIIGFVESRPESQNINVNLMVGIKYMPRVILKS